MPTAKKQKGTKKKKAAFKSILFGLTILVLFFLIDSQLRPIITTMSSYFVQQFAVTQMNTAVESALCTEDLNYDDLVTLQMDSNGAVTSIQTNTKEIARIHTLVTQQVNQAMSDLQTADLSIPIGSLSGIVWLSGMGPSVRIKMIPCGVTNTQVLSKLSEAGINQTLHQLTLHITTEISAVIPGYTTTVQVESDYILAESVIVGTVPKYYTRVLSGETQQDETNHISKYGNPRFPDEEELS